MNTQVVNSLSYYLSKTKEKMRGVPRQRLRSTAAVKIADPKQNVSYIERERALQLSNNVLHTRHDLFNGSINAQCDS